MFNKLKKLFFVEEEQEEVVVNVEATKEVAVTEENFEQTIAITSLGEVAQEVTTNEKPLTTFTLSDSTSRMLERRNNLQQSTYEFETIISPISGRTKPNEEKTQDVKPKVKKKETESFTEVISPMYGQRKTQNSVDVHLQEEGEEITLEEFLSENNKDIELIQFSLFESEKE